MKRYYFDDCEGTIEENEHGQYVKYDDMLLFIANNTATEGATTSLALRALRELVMRRDDRITELEAELKKTKDRGAVYISKDLLNVTNGDGAVRVSIGAIHKNAADADPVISKAVAKEPVTDEKGFAVSEGKVFINDAYITKADDALHARIIALETVTQCHSALHAEHAQRDKSQNQRINDIEDALQTAFSYKWKGRNEQTKNLEDAIRRGVCEMLQHALRPGGILHRY